MHHSTDFGIINKHRKELIPMPDHGIFEKVEIHGAVPGFIIQHTRPGSKIVKSHWHPELEINTVFEGSSRFFINGRVEDVTP